MAGPVDLHSHTTASDGTLAPRELVREAARRGVRVLAVTDHDSTEGLAEARAAAVDVTVDLDAGHDLEGTAARGLVERLGQPLGGVVIGNGEHAHAPPRGLPHELTRRQGAVGGRRVRMEVDGAQAISRG